MLSPLTRSLPAAFLLIATLSLASAQEAELAKFSQFKAGDISAVLGGEIKSQRGNAAPERGVTVESLFAVTCTPERAAQELLTWSPKNHPDMKVFLHQDIAVPATAASFTNLERLPDNASTKALIKSTTGDRKELQLSKAEAASFASFASAGNPSAQTAAFWQSVLLNRSSKFLGGGFPGLPSYDLGGKSYSVPAELKALLNSAPAIKANFSSILGAGPLASLGVGSGGGAISGPVHYWELFDVQGTATVNLGFVQGQQSGTGYKLVDTQYYSSGGYLASLVFYQMWPIEKGGKSYTLVWRGDLVAAQQLGELKGIEKMAAGMVMLGEVKHSIRYYQQDVTVAR